MSVSLKEENPEMLLILFLSSRSISPRALISDFGTSEEMLRGQRERTGHTGTLE